MKNTVAQGRVDFNFKRWLERMFGLDVGEFALCDIAFAQNVQMKYDWKADTISGVGCVTYDIGGADEWEISKFGDEEFLSLTLYEYDEEDGVRDVIGSFFIQKCVYVSELNDLKLTDFCPLS